MIRFRGWMICLVALAGSGCAAPGGQQSADLTAPPAPRMAWTRAARTAPTSKPLPQDLVLREQRFMSHSAELNLDGEDQVQQIATALRDTRAKIVIESCSGVPLHGPAKSGSVDESSKLDLMRRQQVIKKLLSLGIPDAEERVVLEAST